jgi:putative transposase
MGTAYRTLVLQYDLLWLPPEVAEKISMFLKVQEEFRKWTIEWARSGGKSPLPEHNPLKYFAKEFLYADKMLDWLKGLRENGIKVGRIRPPLVFDACLRLERERDKGRGVFVDISKKEVRIRSWSGQRGNTIVLPLAEKAAKWILERVREGGRLVLATAWVGRSRRCRDVKLYVALVFRREVSQVGVKRLLVVDFNALHNGLVWAVVEGGRIVTKGILRPHVSKILRLQKVGAGLDSLCAREDKACNEAPAVRSRIWRILREWEDQAVKKLISLALQYKAAIIVDMPFTQSIKELKEGHYASEKKIFLNFGRLRRRLRGLTEWYGIPYHEKRLYSTLCPRCEAKMSTLPNRRVKCQCGFEAHRDDVPLYWAQRHFQLVSFSNSTLEDNYLVVQRYNVAASVSPSERAPTVITPYLDHTRPRRSRGG